jgi:uncharacterized RDD family membrane protein YckC
MTDLSSSALDSATLEPAPVVYAGLNARMFAAMIDLSLIMIVANPLIGVITRFFYPPIDPAPLIALIGQWGNGVDDPHRFLLAFFDMLAKQHFIQVTLLQNALSFAFVACYILPFWRRYSTTPGKMLFRLKIVDQTTGDAMTDRQMLRRFFGYLLAALPLTLGFMWCVIDRKSRNVEDLFAHTVVVRRPGKPLKLKSLHMLSKK